MGCFACEMFDPLDVIRTTQCDLFATICLQLLDFGTCAYSAHLTFHRAAAGYVLFRELGTMQKWQNTMALLPNYIVVWQPQPNKNGESNYWTQKCCGGIACNIFVGCRSALHHVGSMGLSLDATRLSKQSMLFGLMTLPDGNAMCAPIQVWPNQKINHLPNDITNHIFLSFIF